MTQGVHLPLYRCSATDRVILAQQYLDQQVRVTEHPGRFADHERVIEGRLIAVTTSPTANGAELIVVRVRGEALASAITLANVAQIEAQ